MSKNQSQHQSQVEAHEQYQTSGSDIRLSIIIIRAINPRSRNKFRLELELKFPRMKSPPSAPSGSTTQVTTRKDLSLLYRLLRLLIRPLRPRLVEPPSDPYPAGSHRLFENNSKINIKKKGGCHVEESRREGIWEYTFRPRPVNRKSTREGSGAQKNKKGRRERQPQNDQGKPANSSPSENDRGKPDSASLPEYDQEEPDIGLSPKRKHRIYYFAGGGFQSPPSGEHWLFLAQMAQECADSKTYFTSPSQSYGAKRSRTPSKQPHLRPPPEQKSEQEPENGPGLDIEIILVSHPLAPASPAAHTLPALRKWLVRILNDAVAQGDAVTLMGDSSGGNIALSLGFWAVQNYRIDATAVGGREGLKLPLISLVCISPPVDLRNTNPNIPEYNKRDPVLTMELTSRVARTWTTDAAATETSAPPSIGGYVPSSADDPDTSPLLNPDVAFSVLKIRGVAIHGMIGTHDVLAPDALEFMRRCESFGISGHWLVWEGQMHCFPLAGGWKRIGLREGREGRAFLVDLLKGEAARC